MNKQLIKRIKQVLLYLIGFVLLLYILVMMIIPNKTMDLFGFRSFVVVSSSMEPDINRNDMIFIRNTLQEDIDVGDAITFYVYIPEVDQKSYVTHYVGDIDENSEEETIYYTQGATSDPGDYDEWTDSSGNDIDITYSDIEGTYWFRIPYIGYGIQALKDPVMVGLLAFNGLLIYWIIKLWKTHKEDQKDTD